MRLLIVAGGTGGHIYPGIAVAQAAQKKDPQVEIVFIGSLEGLEKDIISQQGFNLEFIKARALLRKLSYKAISAPFVSLQGFFQALAKLKQFKPNVVVSTGGYVSLPVISAAYILRIPIIILEQNTLPGIVNRLAARFAKKVFLSFPESKKYLKGEVIGNPVRAEILAAEVVSARQKLGLAAGKKVVLVMGGSQGSKKINEVVLSSLDKLSDSVQVVHIIGNRDFGWLKRHVEGKNMPDYHPLPYLDQIADALAAADLVVSRAGATAIFEFLARGLPMILIPFPYAANNHQQVNAEAIEAQGGAVVVKEADFTPEKFIALLSDQSLNYAKMSKISQKLATPGAAKKVIGYIYAQF